MHIYAYIYLLVRVCVQDICHIIQQITYIYACVQAMLRVSVFPALWERAARTVLSVFSGHIAMRHVRAQIRGGA